MKITAKTAKELWEKMLEELQKEKEVKMGKEQLDSIRRIEAYYKTKSAEALELRDRLVRETDNLKIAYKIRDNSRFVMTATDEEIRLKNLPQIECGFYPSSQHHVLHPEDPIQIKLTQLKERMAERPALTCYEKFIQRLKGDIEKRRLTETEYNHLRDSTIDELDKEVWKTYFKTIGPRVFLRG